ncbi:MAG TPA: AI-2E family transporter [Chloroflexota bacterium]|nr:AI-2E family transporter [Chloroflexota bacterium]
MKRRATAEDWQRALYIPLTILAWLVVVLVAGWLLSHVLKTVLTIVMSGIVAFALTPLVSFFQRWIPRSLAIALAYVIGFGLIFALLGLLIVTVAGQVNDLVSHLPKYAREAHRLEPQIVRLLGPFGVTSAKFHQAQTNLIAYLQGTGTAAAKDSLDIVTSVVGTIVDIVLVLILSVYLTANGPAIARRLRRETPGDQRRHTILLIAIVNRVVGGYIRGTLTMATLIGLLVGVGLFFLRVPYSALLGVLAFFMEFVPILGVLISGAVSVGVALFVGPITAVLVLAYFVLVHVIEGDILGPRIMGKAVGIHPATALVALVAGTELFGFWGALLAAPLAGLLQAVGTAALIEIRGGDPRAVVRAVADEATEQAREKADAVVVSERVEDKAADESRREEPVSAE